MKLYEPFRLQARRDERWGNIERAVNLTMLKVIAALLGACLLAQALIYIHRF